MRSVKHPVSEWLFWSVLLAGLNHGTCLSLWKASGDSILMYPIDPSENERCSCSLYRFKLSELRSLCGRQGDVKTHKWVHVL